jgi:hypothetical protein
MELAFRLLEPETGITTILTGALFLLSRSLGGLGSLSTWVGGMAENWKSA